MSEQQLTITLAVLEQAIQDERESNAQNWPEQSERMRRARSRHQNRPRRVRPGISLPKEPETAIRINASQCAVMLAVIETLGSSQLANTDLAFVLSANRIEKSNRPLQSGTSTHVRLACTA